MRNRSYRHCASRNRRHVTQRAGLVLRLTVLLLVVLLVIVQQSMSSPGPRAKEAPLPAQSPAEAPAFLPDTPDTQPPVTPMPTPWPATPMPTSTPEPTPQSTPCFPLAGHCFEGQPDYCYFDQRLAVQIRQHVEGEMVYFICDIQTTDPTALRTALSAEKIYGSHEHTSDIASRHGAVLAINGDDYGVHRNGVIIRGGELIRAKQTTRHLLTLDAAGDLRIAMDPGPETPKAFGDRLLSQGIREAWAFGPALVRDGEAVSFPPTFDLISVRDETLEPRTAIGQIGPLHYVIIMVDGRREGYAKGISLSGLQQLFVDTGAHTAFNLDGGGSTTLYFCGQVLNKPSGGGQRSVSDILYF